MIWWITHTFKATHHKFSLLSKQLMEQNQQTPASRWSDKKLHLPGWSLVPSAPARARCWKPWPAPDPSNEASAASEVGEGSDFVHLFWEATYGKTGTDAGKHAVVLVSFPRRCSFLFYSSLKLRLIARWSDFSSLFWCVNDKIIQWPFNSYPKVSTMSIP